MRDVPWSWVWLTALAVCGCDRRTDDVPPPAPPPRVERAPYGLAGTFRLAPDGLRGVAAPETPLLYVDLEVSGDRIGCVPWRPDGQEAACVGTAWLPPSLQLELTRSYRTRDGEEVNERWYFRGQLEETPSGRFLNGLLDIRPEEGASVRPYKLRVHAQRVQVNQDELAEAWQAAEQVELQRELNARRGQAEPPLPNRTYQMPTQDPAPGRKPGR